MALPMPHRYPQEAVLRDGRRVLLRPFTARDADALYQFFQRQPAATRRFAWDRVDERRTIDGWAENLDYDKVFPLLAWHGSQIVADATLHRREGGPLRRVGRIKWTLDPAYRGVGLGLLLVNHFIDSARFDGLRHLSCMLIADLEADAIETLETLGFRSTIIPGYGADPDGGEHDMAMMVLRL
jgi:GNAT superfamily N-acetyltransferase